MKFILAFLILSCTTIVNSKPDPLSQCMLPESLAPEWIIGEEDWIPVEQGIPEMRCMAKAVGVLYNYDKGYRCTGFKVGDRLVMSNAHCAPDQDHAKGIYMVFDYERDKLEYPVFKCDKLVTNNSLLDYALLECEEASAVIPHYTLKKAPEQRASDRMYMIHQNCNYYTQSGCDPYKKISLGVIYDVRRARLLHTADSLGGSSGSPIIDLITNEVIGIHNSGYRLDPTLPDGHGNFNGGYVMNFILEDLEDKGIELK